MADMETQTDEFTKALEAQRTATEATKTNALDEYLKSLTTQKGMQTLTAEAYAAPGGVDAITPELNAINDQIRREQLSLRRATERIQGMGGGLEAGAAAEIQNLERESLAKQADLSVIQMATQGRYDSAKAIADRAVSAKLEQQTNYTAALKVAYEDAKDAFTTAEQREFSTLLADRERKIADEKALLTSIQDFALAALQAGAPTSVAQQIQGAKTLEEAMALGGEYLRPKATGTGGFKAPEIKNFGTNDAPMWKQFNETTGQWEDVSGIGGATTGAGGQSLENLNTKYTELLADIGDAQTLVSSGAAGAGIIERGFKSLFTSNADYKQLENIADTIKSNLLTLNTDPNIKKFFGPQMSNRDTELMTGAASTLNPEKQTPDQIRRDLQDAAGVIARAREAVRVGLGQGTGAGTGVAQNIILAPDGTSIEIID
jgi:hypothetical protein